MKSDEIWKYLLNGTIDDWERIAGEINNFPDGNELHDEYIGYVDYEWCVRRHWITNAIDRCSLESIKWMLSKKVNLHFVDSEGYSVLHACIDRELPDKYSIMQLLIDNGADINIGTQPGQMAIEGWTPLHMAARRNDLEAIKLLLHNGADTTIKTIIDDYCDAGQTALMVGNNEAAELINSYNKPQK